MQKRWLFLSLLVLAGVARGYGEGALNIVKNANVVDRWFSGRIKFPVEGGIFSVNANLKVREDVKKAVDDLIELLDKDWSTSVKAAYKKFKKRGPLSLWIQGGDAWVKKNTDRRDIIRYIMDDYTGKNKDVLMDDVASLIAEGNELKKLIKEARGRAAGTEAGKGEAGPVGARTEERPFCLAASH